MVDSAIDEESFKEKLDQHRRKSQFVFVDLEGTANRLMFRALFRAHLAIIPIQASPTDAELAAKAIHLIKDEGGSHSIRLFPTAFSLRARRRRSKPRSSARFSSI